MRLTALVLALFVLAAPATAVVQNGSSPSNQVGDGEMGITSHTGRADQSFGGGDGPTYHMTFTTTNTSSGIGQDYVNDVSIGARYVELSGAMQVPTPCHGLSTTQEVSGNVLTLTVETHSDAEACVQQVVTKHYRLDLQADEPFRLELVHGDDRVKRVDTTGYPPETEKTGRFIAFLKNLFNSLF